MTGTPPLGGRVALVSGAARGIGQACALALARDGADVAAADLLAVDETLAAVRGRGRRSLGLGLDVTDGAAVGDAVARVERELGRLDILVTAAGILHRDGLEETSDATWDRVVDVVLKGTFLLIQAATPVMRRQGYGRIVTISSISGIIGGATSRSAPAGQDAPGPLRGRSGPAYAAAKGGVIALTKWVARDLGQFGIRVNSVAPGGIDTDMTRGYAYPVDSLPIARLGRAEEVADAVAYLCAPASDYVTGQVLRVDGGWVV